jgi:hypothetical protein
LDGLDGLAGHDVPQGPDWGRLTILFLWYLSGVPITYIMQDSCSVGSPGIWARAFRVFIEGVVAFGLGGFIYVGVKFILTAFHHFTVFLAGAGQISIPEPPSASGRVAIRSRKGAIYSLQVQRSRRISISVSDPNQISLWVVCLVRTCSQEPAVVLASLYVLHPFNIVGYCFIPAQLICVATGWFMNTFTARFNSYPFCCICSPSDVYD